MRRILLVLTLIAAAALAPAPALADPASMLALQRYDQRLLEIGYRLAVRGRDLCDVQARLPGFTLHDITQYPANEQPDARLAFGFASEPLILAVAPTGPAEGAGLHPGDAILTIDGQPLPPAKRKANNSYVRMRAILAQLETAASDGMIELTFRRGTQTLTAHVPAAMGCPSLFQTDVSSLLASQADGRYVEISTGMIDFTASDDQLAAIVAHELAHNILHHRARLDAVGIHRGLLGQFGRNARLIRQTEIEADRLSVYLMDLAGYDTQAIIAFWQHYDETHPLDFLAASTHPKPSSRIKIVREEMARIAEMRAAGRTPRPAFMEGPTLPELR